MLLQIRDFIRREHVVTTQQVARAFHIDEHSLQPMLDLWVKKGVIRASESKSGCVSRCFRCKTNTPLLYTYAS